jgi:hypothetical protein
MIYLHLYLYHICQFFITTIPIFGTVAIKKLNLLLLLLITNNNKPWGILCQRKQPR